ncbi:MAG: hypothetical protein LBG89_00455 [Rickettsiales bacterium]|jgi:hypothetical protein|nr:hypothetical protein [Rickettsiales bacterium]
MNSTLRFFLCFTAILFAAHASRAADRFYMRGTSFDCKNFVESVEKYHKGATTMGGKLCYFKNGEPFEKGGKYYLSQYYNVYITLGGSSILQNEWKAGNHCAIAAKLLDPVNEAYNLIECDKRDAAMGEMIMASDSARRAQVSAANTPQPQASSKPAPAPKPEAAPNPEKECENEVKKFVQQHTSGNFVCYPDGRPLEKNWWYLNPATGVFIKIGASRPSYCEMKNLLSSAGDLTKCDDFRRAYEAAFQTMRTRKQLFDGHGDSGRVLQPTEWENIVQLYSKVNSKKSNPTLADIDAIEEINSLLQTYNEEIAGVIKTNLTNKNETAADSAAVGALVRANEALANDLRIANDDRRKLEQNMDKFVPAAERANIVDAALLDELNTKVATAPYAEAEKALPAFKAELARGNRNLDPYKKKFDDEQTIHARAKENFTSLFRQLDREKTNLPLEMKSDFNSIDAFAVRVSNSNTFSVAEYEAQSEKIRAMLKRMDDAEKKTESDAAAETARQTNMKRAKILARSEDPLKDSTAKLMITNFRIFNEDFTEEERDKLKDYIIAKHARGGIISEAKFEALSNKIVASGGKFDPELGTATITGLAGSEADEFAWLEYFVHRQFTIGTAFGTGDVNVGSDKEPPLPLLTMDSKLTNYNRWVSAKGEFIGAKRALVDSAFGVGLGIAGGVMVNSLMKSSQSESGFENVQCTINEIPVASWRDTFSISPSAK